MTVLCVLAYLLGRSDKDGPAPDLSRLRAQIESLERERSILRAELARQTRIERRLMRRDTILSRAVEQLKPTVTEECAEAVGHISRLFEGRLALRDTIIAEQKALITSLAATLERQRDSTLAALQDAQRAVLYWQKRAKPDLVARLRAGLPYIAVGIILGAIIVK